MATKVLKQRPGTVKRASDAFLLFVELEQAEAVLVSSISCAAGLLHLQLPWQPSSIPQQLLGGQRWLQTQVIRAE